jgi:hypothetical protein
MHRAGRPCNLFMRLRSEDGENAVFKDDKGRFTSDINKTNTLKLRVDTAYQILLESPKNMRVKTISIQGAPVEMDEAPARMSKQSDGVKSVSVGTWHTSCFEPSGQSCREKLEFIFVLEVDGLQGPNSDEMHLLKAKMICKFYSRENAKYRDKGFSLGAIKLRCLMGGVSKITGVTFADMGHTEKLEVEAETADFASSFREFTLAGDDDAAADDPPRFMSARKPLKVVQTSGFESPLRRSPAAGEADASETPHTAVKKLLGLDLDTSTPEWRKQPASSSSAEYSPEEVKVRASAADHRTTGRELSSLQEEEEEEEGEEAAAMVVLEGSRKQSADKQVADGAKDRVDLFAADAPVDK